MIGGIIISIHFITFVLLVLGSHVRQF